MTHPFPTRRSSHIKSRHRPGRDGGARPDRPHGPAPRLGGQPRAGAVEGAGHRYPLASLALAGTATRARPKAAPGSRTARAWMRFACPRLRVEETLLVICRRGIAEHAVHHPRVEIGRAHV